MIASRILVVVSIAFGFACGDRAPPENLRAGSDELLALRVDRTVAETTRPRFPVVADELAPIHVGGGAGMQPKLRCPPSTRADAIAAFIIDSRPATPAEYDTCVEVQACAPSPQPAYWRTKLDEASVSIDGALAFCRRRGGRLPSFAEWQLTMTPLADGAKPPSCAHPLFAGAWQDCEQVAPSGAHFRLRNSNLGEWLSDQNCDGPTRRPVAIGLAGDEASDIAELADAYAVRCAFDATPKGAGR